MQIVSPRLDMNRSMLTIIECAKRWKHFLDPSLDHSEWSTVEDERLLVAVEQCGRDWKTITTKIFPGRSPTNVKNR